MEQRPQPEPADVLAWLTHHHGTEVEGLEQLAGGFWSIAYAYLVDDRPLVFRLGTIGEGFVADRDAMAFTRPHLPVPRVLHVGEALGWACAISERHHGLFLEDTSPGAALGQLLLALRSVEPVDGPSFQSWLTRSARQDDKIPLLSPEHADLHGRLLTRIDQLRPAVPERRDLVHGDLLHQNVLVDRGEISAVFSWKCSQRGDHLYDTAWCTFWAPWFAGIVEADAWAQTPDPGPDAGERHLAYQLHIAATHLGWMTWTGDDADLVKVAARAEELMTSGH